MYIQQLKEQLDHQIDQKTSKLMLLWFEVNELECKKEDTDGQIESLYREMFPIMKELLPVQDYLTFYCSAQFMNIFDLIKEVMLERFTL